MTITINDFIRAHALAMTAERADSNPNMPDSSNMDHWKCRLICRPGDHRRTMTVYFSMGLGLNGKTPELAEVLDCLASDAAGLANATGFDDWCSDYGYDPDSRKAERIYKTIERQAARLRKFLGNVEFKALLWDTERE